MSSPGESTEKKTLPLRLKTSLPPNYTLTPPLSFRDEMTWIDYSTRSNPLGTPDSFKEALEHVTLHNEYSYAPDSAGYVLKKSLSQYFQLSTHHFLIGGSVNDLVRAAAQTFNPTVVGITMPSERGFSLAIENAGHSTVEIMSNKGFLPPDPSLSKSKGITFDAALLANPSYPTSRLLSKSTLLRYLETCSWVLVDERSIELTLGGESYVQLVHDYQNLIIIRSLSESYGISGIPISYIVAHPNTVTAIEAAYDPSNISVYAEALGARLPEEFGFLERTREFLETEIPWLQCMLSLIPGIDIFPAESNYVLCTFSPVEGMQLCVESVEELSRKLELSGFLIKKLNDTPGLQPNRHFCVSVRTHSENEKLVRAMRRIITSEER